MGFSDLVPGDYAVGDVRDTTRAIGTDPARGATVFLIEGGRAGVVTIVRDAVPTIDRGGVFFARIFFPVVLFRLQSVCVPYRVQF